MTMPAGIATVTLTGRYIHPDGAALTGSITIAAPSLITLSGADTITAGAVTATLNAQGAFSVTLVATDNTAMQPTGWAYDVTETLTGFAPRTYSIVLPQAVPAVDLADIAPANPADGDYVLVTGPTGPSGRTILNGTVAPAAGVGANGDFYIDTVAWKIYGPKASGAWPAGYSIGGGGGGVIASVNGKTGTVVLNAADVNADAAGAASTAQTAAVASAATYTDSAVATEASARDAAVVSEATARINALAAEVTRADAAYVGTGDSRLTDDRNPTYHASSHAAGGVDPVSPASIGAAAATDLTTLAGRVTANEGTLAARARYAIRRGGIADPGMTDLLYSGSAPTISTTQTTTSTIASAVKYAPPLVTLAGTDVRGDFLWCGAADFAIGTIAPDTSYALPTSKTPHLYSSGQSAWALEFTTDADAFEMRFKYIAATSMYKLSIDGRPVTATPVSLGGTTIGSGHMLKVAFGSSAMRRIRLDLFTVPFGGIYIGPTFTLFRPVTVRGRLMVLGDSITDGSAQNSGQGVGTWLYRAARMLGVTDVWDQARGGTGYITPGSFQVFGDRLTSDIVAYAPDVLIIKGGYNDNGGSQSAIGAAAASLYAAAQAALPNTQIIVVGPWVPTATPAGSLVTTDSTLAAAALAAGLPFVSFVTGNTLSGTGVVVSTQTPLVTSGNVATVVGADNVHPTDAGHALLGRWMVRALAPILPL
jgi:lysophospholipase L1-like esterase